MIGTSLNQYRITASIGAGGMGEVFRARDTRLNRDVAVKVLPKDFVADVDRLRRFEQEAKTLAALNHPNVLTIHDAGVHEGAPYLVSELLEGRTLREEMNGAALPVRKATEFGLQIAHGLAAAHGKGIIHRDLKPENIFVTKDGRVKILDFGLAKLRNPSPGLRPPSPLGGERDGVRGDAAAIGMDAETLLNTTEPGMVLGTPAYMSPEQVRGEPADHRADIFAFGCVLYEMLSGTRAFRRNTPVETMNAILAEEPPELVEVNPSVASPLERVARRCLEKRPDVRFQTATDLAFAIETVGAVPTSAWRRAASAEPSLSAKGGEAKPVLLTEAQDEICIDVSALPKGRAALCVVNRAINREDTIAVWISGRSLQTLLQIPGSDIHDPVYSPSGHVLFQRNDAQNRGLWAFAFSLATWERIGEPFRVSDEGRMGGVAEDGTLAINLVASDVEIARQLVWVDRSGQITRPIGSPHKGLFQPRLSPDERRIAAVSGESWSGFDIWIFDVARGSSIPLMRNQDAEIAPYWFPDGRRILFSRFSQGTRQVFVRPVEGGAEEKLSDGFGAHFNQSGKYLLLQTWRGATNWSYVAVADTSKHLVPFPENFQRIRNPRLSPDNTLLTYLSGETGQDELYLVAFPGFTNSPFSKVIRKALFRSRFRRMEKPSRLEATIGR